MTDAAGGIDRRRVLAALIEEERRRYLARGIPVLDERELAERIESAVDRAERVEPRFLERAAARLSQGAWRGKSGKSQDFTLSGCQLMLRQEPARETAKRRLRWIVRPESGRRNERKPGQPLVPAAFFACGAPGATHLE